MVTTKQNPPVDSQKVTVRGREPKLHYGRSSMHEGRQQERESRGVLKS